MSIRLSGVLLIAVFTATLMAGAAILPTAHAGSFYVETSAGISQFRGGGGFFGPGLPDVTDFGFGFNAGIFWNVSNPRHVAEFHFGISERLSSASSGTTNASMHGPYLLARLQMSKIYVGLGFSPFIWRRVRDTPSLMYFSKAPNTYAALLESGILWAVTPEFSLGLAAGTQWVKSDGSFSPRPALDAMVLMRFYFGFTGGTGEGRSSGEFKGWRYPFGWQLTDG